LDPLSSLKDFSSVADNYYMRTHRFHGNISVQIPYFLCKKAAHFPTPTVAIQGLLFAFRRDETWVFSSQLL
jgi:hypothetical protein